MIRGPWLDVRKPDTHHRQPLVEGVDVAIHDLFPRYAFLVCFGDDLIVDIRNVLNEGNLVVPALEIPGNYIPKERRPDVADVDVVVDGGATDVDTYLTVLPNLDRTTAKSIVYAYAHKLSLASLARSIRPRDSSTPSMAKRYAISGPRSRPVRANRKG